MPVVSAVLHLRTGSATGVRADLSGLSEIVPGAPVGDRLPVVADTASRRDDRALWRTVLAHPHVLGHELVFADFSDLHTEEPHGR